MDQDLWQGVCELYRRSSGNDFQPFGLLAITWINVEFDNNDNVVYKMWAVLFRTQTCNMVFRNLIVPVAITNISLWSNKFCVVA